MKTKFKLILAFFSYLLLTSCSTPENQIPRYTNSTPTTNNSLQLETKKDPIKYLALGDSYTIGQSVCETCRFPEQLKNALKLLNPENSFNLKIIAQTGWTTSDLISAINTANLSSDYDFVTLLIGVNNQYRSYPFSVYEKEFPALVAKAISFAKGNKNKIIIISIPDYAYTPFGQSFGDPATISAEIDNYNTFAKSYCEANAITYINITDISRQGLSNTNLVASDGLHPSNAAYTLFVERLLPKSVNAIQQN